MREMNGTTPPVLFRKDVEALIAQGRKLFILDDLVIKADAWIPYHPGGDKSILHIVGRDTTDKVTALVLPQVHPRAPSSCPDATEHALVELDGRMDHLLTSKARQSSLDRGKTTYEPVPHRDNSRQMGELRPAYPGWHVPPSI